MKPSEYLRNWMNRNPEPWSLGEVVIFPGYELRQEGDAGVSAETLQTLTDFEALRERIKYQEDGRFRPVRGFRGLRRGWRMRVQDVPELLLALNWIYPGCVAVWAEYEVGLLQATQFEETVQRQTGMYRITQVITPEQLTKAIGESCEANCLRQRLWGSDSQLAVSPSRIPLICPEACNYLVSKASQIVKENRAE